MTDLTPAQEDILGYLVNCNGGCSEMGTSLRSPDWFQAGYGEALRQLASAALVKLWSEKQGKVKHYFASITETGLWALGKYHNASSEDILAALTELKG